MAGKLLAILAGASMLTAVAGVATSHRAVQSAEAFKAEALAWHGKAQELQRRLEASQGIRAELEAKLKEAQKGLTQEQRRILSTHVAGRPGTLAYKNANPCNIKELSKGRKWRGQTGVDSKGHCRFSSIQYGLRAAAFTLRSYEKKHNIKTLKGLVDRFCGGNADYVAFLSRRMNLDPEQEFSFTARMPELLRYMSIYESGREASPDMIAMFDLLSSI